MSNTIGVLLNDVSLTQLNYKALTELNNLNFSSNHNCVAFYNNVSQPCTNNFCALINTHEIHKVRNGTLIATTLETAEILLKSQTNSRKVFYVWSLEWIHNKGLDYMKNVGIMRSLELWTRSESYADVIENYCNVRPKIAEDFNLKEIAYVTI